MIAGLPGNFNETTKAILFPMRTNNKYEENWTLADGDSTIENHVSP